MRELTDVFGKETDDVLSALQKGDITENVKYLAFNKLLDMQPVALSEVPEMYLKAGNGRIFYMLKTWTLKMLDVYRNEAFSKMRSKETFKEGFGNMLKLTATLAAAEMTSDQLKDWMLGRKTEFKDRLVDTLLKLTTFNRYSVSQAKQEGIGTAFTKKILPPTGLIDDIWKDASKILTNTDASIEVNKLRTIQDIPIGGKLYYWWLEKGADYKEKYESKQKKFDPKAFKKSLTVQKNTTMGGMSTKDIKKKLGL